MIIILGPTATGKTAIATRLAYEINGEIISADSRQVFKGMDIGTGKDLSEYTINGSQIPYHLIDIVEPGTEYSVFNFQKDCYRAYDQILENARIPILCGGTGLYIESVIRAYPMVNVPENSELRAQLAKKSLQELAEILVLFKKLHNHTDTENRERVERAIEIETFYRDFPELVQQSKKIIQPISVFGIYHDRTVIRNRITTRLKQRLESGMIDEVKLIHDNGVSYERLQKYGLEYKFVSLYLQNKLSDDALFSELNIAIHQFAKRQTTWFRRMEKNGIHINWIEGGVNSVNDIKKMINI